MYLNRNKKATNAACKGEMGKFPLIISFYKRILNYISHINTLPDTTIVKQAFLLSKELYNNNKSSLYSNITKIIKTLTHNNNEINYNETNKLGLTNYNSKINEYINNAKNKYITFWKHKINNSSKLSFYNTFKQNFELEDYLTSIRNPKQRKIFAQPRTGSHTLEIEQGRYHSTPREQRLCTLGD